MPVDLGGIQYSNNLCTWNIFFLLAEAKKDLIRRKPVFNKEGFTAHSSEWVRVSLLKANKASMKKTFKNIKM